MSLCLYITFPSVLHIFHVCVCFCARVPLFVRACHFLCARVHFCARVSISERACQFLRARPRFCARVPLFACARPFLRVSLFERACLVLRARACFCMRELNFARVYIFPHMRGFFNNSRYINDNSIHYQSFDKRAF